MATNGLSGGGIGRFMLGFLFAPGLLALAITIYFWLGRPPVAVADSPMLLEKLMLRHPVNKRVDYELTGPPFGSSPEVFEAGARIYKTDCASCHGTPDHDSPFAMKMYPGAPQLFKRYRPDDVVGVSQNETGRTYWKIAHGIRLTGMPSYSNLLTDTEMWQVALLLKHAQDKLPDPVLGILNSDQ